MDVGFGTWLGRSSLEPGIKFSRAAVVPFFVMNSYSHMSACYFSCQVLTGQKKYQAS